MQYIYAALLLHKLGKEINEESLKKVIVAAGAEADDAKIKALIASLKGVDIAKELEHSNLNIAAPTVSTSSEQPKTEEKPKEKKEAAAEGLSALFG
jgi:large subunit ribosomal protein L12